MKKLICLIIMVGVIFNSASGIYAINDENETNEVNIENVEKDVVLKEPENKTDEIVEPEVNYRTHVEDYAWLPYVSNGEMSGTTMESKRLEAIQIKLNSGTLSGGISYSTYVQDIGWTDFVSDDSVSGTTGKKLRIEAIKIKLTGEISEYYDVYYRVHVQEFGWLDWASNGKGAGSQTYNYRLEGIEIKLVKKGEAAPGAIDTPFKSPGNVYYKTHVEDYGWQEYVNDGKTSGTSGKSKQIEALRIGISNLPYEGNIEYSSHIQNIGWQEYKSEEMISGTVGLRYQIEAVKIRLTGEVAEYYDVYYRVHIEDYGWLDWAKNGEKAGSEGLELRMEAIEIKLVTKGNDAPGKVDNPFIGFSDVNYSVFIEKNGWQSARNNGETSGTVGKGLQLKAIKINLSNSSYSGEIKYSTHVQNIGWIDYVSDGQISGFEKDNNQIEAIKIKLTGEIAEYYDVYYRVQCQEVGWLGWTCNDLIAGTVGGNFGIEAIEIKLYPKLVEKPEISSRSSSTFKLVNGYNLCYDAFGNLREDAQEIMGLQGSYLLRVNKETNVVTVLVKDGKGKYNIAYKRFICSTGVDTPVGTFYTPAKYRWRELIGPSYGQYSTRIVGGILFHSVPYNKMNPYTLSPRMYNQLGTTCSHGCIRLTCRDAKWIYDHCALKTKVNIVAGGHDPLSKPTAQKLPMNQTWDPTDPNI